MGLASLITTRADQHGEQASDNQSGEHLLHHHRLLSETAAKVTLISLGVSLANAAFPFWVCTFLT